ncbi:MAG: protein kinase [Kofleriaceae bacterium]|nr:protein kinase [Kofleriaceae bacterium]
MTTPHQLGSYRIVDVLGRGGMGVVYVGVDDRTGEAAAVKTVRVPTESTLDSIRREILTLRELRHPGVVRIRDTGVAHGMPWYAMDLLRGYTLRDYLRRWYPAPTTVDADTQDLRRPGHGDGRGRDPDAVGVGTGDGRVLPEFSLARCLALFRAVCEPLAYVHGEGVVHRDLTPGNLFVLAGAEPAADGLGRPVLFDFGIASQVRGEGAREVLEVGGYTRGTAHYMAPEQARGEVVDARADVYALGCLLYEALTGRPPFLADSTVSVMMQHLEDPPAPPSRWNPALPPALDALLLHMLAKRPRERLGYVADVAAALGALGAAPVEPGPVAPAPRGYVYRPPLAGRAELVAGFVARLERLGDAAASDAAAGGWVALVGESGVGKTRLAAAIATAAVERDLTVITGEAVHLAGVAAGEPDEVRAGPLHPLRPLLRVLADRCREGGRAESTRLLGADAAVLAPFEPELAAAVTLAVEPAASGPADVARGEAAALAGRYRVAAVLRQALLELAVGQPLVLVIDDLQWADELTVAALSALTAADLRAAGILVLVTIRAEELTGDVSLLLDRPGVERIDVGRLDAAAVGEMLRDMLALEAPEPELAGVLADASEGNPFFAAEYLRVAVEEGLLRRDQRGRWLLADGGAAAARRLPIPGSVQELVRRRLRDLDARCHRVLAAAAVLGRDCAVALVRAVAELDDEALTPAIAELRRRQVVDEHDGALRFEHDKLREVAYADLAEPARTDLHRRAALAIEVHTAADHRALWLPALAHHWEHARDLARAADALEEAAAAALHAAAYGQASALLRHLLALGLEVAAPRRARWERWLGEAAYALGDLAACARHTRAAIDLLGHRLPRGRAGHTGALLAGVTRRVLGVRPRRAPDADRAEAALAAARMTSCYFFDDDALAMLGASLMAVNLAERSAAAVPVAEAYSQLGYVAGLARMPAVAERYFARALATAESTGDVLGWIKTRYTVAAYQIGLGGWDLARTEAAAAQARARELRNPQEVEVGHTILGHVDFCVGDLAGSRQASQALLDSARARANKQHEAWGLYTVGRADLYADRLEDALAGFEQAAARLADLRDHASSILCGGLHAWAVARAGDVDGAVRRADEVTSLIGRRMPSVFTIAEGFVGAAEAYLLAQRARPERGRDQASARAIGNLGRFARTFALARPAAARLDGERLVLAGRTRAGRRALTRALRLAEVMALPYDQRRAHLALAELSTGAEAEAHRAAAARLGGDAGSSPSP